jgi:hypothetical protein
MECATFRISVHALKRFDERGFKAVDIERVVREGEIIREYEDTITHGRAILSADASASAWYTLSWRAIRRTPPAWSSPPMNQPLPTGKTI